MLSPLAARRNRIAKKADVTRCHTRLAFLSDRVLSLLVKLLFDRLFSILGA